MIAYAANACRTAADSNCSAAGVSRENLMSPRRVKVRRATGSQSSVETPPFNIAKARCSSTSKSVHAIPSILHLVSPPISRCHDRTRKVKDLLKLSTGPRNEKQIDAFRNPKLPGFVAASPTDPKNILARTSDVRFRR
jgi:hypothetical protein